MRLTKARLEAHLMLIEGAEACDALLPLWQEMYEQPVPKNMSLRMMKLAVAYQLQVRVHGGLKPATRRHLFEVVRSGIAQTKPPNDSVEPGTRLIRQWHGKIYEGVVKADHVVINGQRYGSLSQAAKAITGVHWSGPRFFGITKVKSK